LSPPMQSISGRWNNIYLKWFKMRLKDKVVLITGAARGIGWGIAKLFAKEGAILILNDITAEEVEKRAQELTKNGYNTYSAGADISKTIEVEKMVEEIIDNYGKLDILINNAAVFNSKPILELQEQDWDRVMGVNLKGLFNCSKAAARYMIKEKKGRIVNVASLVGKTGRVIFSEPGSPTWACYTTSKAAIIALTKSMAFEWAPFNVYVNAVAPGPIKTGGTTPEIEKISISRVPLRKMGSVDDVAYAVLFLASDEASFITGEILDVNGGAMMD